MARLSLYWPAKPFIVTQGFGIYNPAYLQFGFSKHNGIDFGLDDDKIVRAMRELDVVETGNKPTGAGIYARLRTLTPVEAEGHTGYVEFFYMHAEKLLCKTGDRLQAGDEVIVADNTGFSTGPHTHISAYFVDPTKPIGQHKLPIGDKEADYCFDFSKYFNGKYSDDILVALQLEIIRLIKAIFAAIHR